MTATLPLYIPLGPVDKEKAKKIEWRQLSFTSEAVPEPQSERKLYPFSLTVPLGFSLNKQQQFN